MAEGEDESQKTEEPTQKRLDDARKKGDVAKSQEIPGWFVLAAGLVLVSVFIPPMARSMAGSLQVFLAEPHLFSVDPNAVLGLAETTAWNVAITVSLSICTLALAGFAGHYIQHGLLFSTEKIQPKLSKINPIEGFKRNFGPQGLANFLKGIGKMGLVSIAAYVVLYPKRDDLAALPSVDITAILGLVRETAIELLVAALSVYAVIAGLDYMFQRQSFMKKNRMSRRDLKDEVKQSDGDPMVRAKLRQIRQERSRRRMMTKVPDAAVVITNPTHYAIALHYEQGKSAAPVCVAKGVDEVALRIRAVAKDNDVPIVEDPPLARALHASAELDEEIPVDHFKAVAKVIGYVLSLSGGRAKYRASS
jgi:flagellar biosynthetic protein FlhB